MDCINASAIIVQSQYCQYHLSVILIALSQFLTMGVEMNVINSTYHANNSFILNHN